MPGVLPPAHSQVKAIFFDRLKVGRNFDQQAIAGERPGSLDDGTGSPLEVNADLVDQNSALVLGHISRLRRALV